METEGGLRERYKWSSLYFYFQAWGRFSVSLFWVKKKRQARPEHSVVTLPERTSTFGGNLSSYGKIWARSDSHFLDPGSRKASEETVKDSHLHSHKSVNAWAEFNFRQK